MMYGYEMSAATRRAPEIEQDLPLVFRASAACARARACTTFIPRTLPARVTDAGGDGGRIYGDQSCSFFAVFCNAPNLAVNYGRSFLRARKQQRFPRLSIPPSAHLRHRCIFMRPITSFRPLSLLRNFLLPDPRSPHTAAIIIRDTNRGRWIVPRIYLLRYYLLSCTSPFIYGTTFSTFLLCYFNERRKRELRWLETEYKIGVAIEVSRRGELKFE